MDPSLPVFATSVKDILNSTPVTSTLITYSGSEKSAENYATVSVHKVFDESPQLTSTASCCNIVFNSYDGDDEIFPKEILTEIFSRVPAKSAGKFRCLSKTWNTVLSTSYFVNLHLSRRTHQESSILLTERVSVYTARPPFENPTNSKKLELEFGDWCRVVGSCNGLVLLFNFKEEMFLLNPTTFENFKLPSVPCDTEEYLFPDVLRGFCYDESTNDYNIIAVCNCRLETSVYVYSMKSGVWKMINHSLREVLTIYMGAISCVAFTNGSSHWPVVRANKMKNKMQFVILAFNFANEVFYEVDIPLAFTGNPDNKWSFKVFAHKGRLCVFNSFEGVQHEIWMMKEYGMVNSWTKLGSVDIDEHMECRILRPLYFSRDEDILLVIKEAGMIVCNLRERTVANVVVDGVPYPYDGCSFVDSLISVKGLASSS